MKAMKANSNVTAGSTSTADGRAAAAPRWRAWLMLSTGLLLLFLALWFAWNQPPHPDPWRTTVSDIGSKDWWLYPVEQNAFKRLPVIQGSLSALHVSKDGQKLWAAGNGGLIVHSPDGGKTWVQQNPRLDKPQAAPEKAAWSPWGEAWAADAPNAPAPSFDPKQQNIAPEIQQNAPVNIPQQIQQQAPQAQDQSAPPEPAKNLATPAPDLKRNIPAPDTRKIVPVSSAATARSTASTSLTQKTRVPAPRAVKSAKPASKAPIVKPAAEAPTPIAQPSDPMRAYLSAIQFIDDLHGWAAGSDGTILATRDGGQTWSPQASGTEARINSVLFVDAQNGWAVGASERSGGAESVESTILATRDGGKTWVAQRSGVRADLASVYFFDIHYGWVVGDRGTILATRDGGQTWTTQASGSEVSLSAVQFINATTGWAVGWGDGTILATRDGGQTWAPQASGSQEQLVGVQFSNATVGWAVGKNGTILATRDGGNNWTPQTSRTRAWLSAVQFADATTGWAVGDDGTILATRNGGKSWIPQASGIGAALLAAKSTDNATGWAVNKHGAILATRDGGKIWQEPVYRVSPAPWVYLALVVGAGLVLAAIRGLAARQAPQQAPGVAELFVSDEPLGPEDRDHLGHDALTRGLANFILNRNTAPSLTLAITASWGQGKSSIMRRLEYRLRAEGFRPAWFNAWHHQQEGRQLASMLNTIRKQAVPPWYTPKAWRVRGSLLWHRGLLYKLTFIATAGLLVIAAIELPSMVRETASILQAASDKPDGFAYVVRTVRSTLLDKPTVLTVAGLEKLRKEAVLDSDALDAMGSSMLWAPNSSTRCRIAGGCEFKSQQEFVASLEKLIAPRRLTIEETSALDSATRHLGASPGTMLGVMLSALVIPLLLGKGLAIYGLNYLDILKRFFPAHGTVEGKEAVGTIERFREEFCGLTQALDERLVLFIDDLDRCDCATVREVLELVNYLTSVGKCFVVLGMAMEHVSPCIPVREGEADQKAYAEKYLKKLINIEVPIPALQADASRTLLQAQAHSSTRPANLNQVLKWAGRLVVALLVIVSATLMYNAWKPWNAPAEPRQLLVVNPAQPAVSQSDTVSSSGGTLARPQPDASTGRVGVDPAPPDNRVDALAGIGSVLSLALLGAGLWLSRPRWRAWLEKHGWLKALKVGLGGAARVQDSGDFVAALEIWHPVIARGDPNPRGIKRFVNRVRFIAMMESEQGDERIPDALLVALGALHHAQVDVPVNPGELAEQTTWAHFSDEEKTAGSELGAAIRTALRKTQGWPPSPQQRERFEQLVRGMYVR